MPPGLLCGAEQFSILPEMNGETIYPMHCAAVRNAALT